MENTNSVQTLTSESTVGTRSNSTEEALGFNEQSAMIGAFSTPNGLQQYVRYSRNGQKCSGVLSWERNLNNVERYDVYFYTARHCFEKSNPIHGATWDFDLKSHKTPLIGLGQALGFNGLNLVALPIRSDYIETLALDGSQGGSNFLNPTITKDAVSYRDVVRLYQYSHGSAGAMIGLCNSQDLYRSGKKGTLGYPKANLKKPNGVVVTASESIDPKLQSASAGLNGVSLQTKMNQWLGSNKVSIDPDIVKLADTTTQPGESGSPVFERFVTTSNGTEDIWFEANHDTKAYRFTCLDGILTREITKLGKLGETYYSVLSKYGHSRRWVRVWSLDGKLQKPERSLDTWDSARTASSIRLQLAAPAPKTASAPKNALSGFVMGSTVIPKKSEINLPKTTPTPQVASVVRKTVKLSLVVIGSWDEVIETSEAVIVNNDYTVDCRNLVGRSAARHSYGEFECLADGKPTGLQYIQPAARPQEWADYRD